MMVLEKGISQIKDIVDRKILESKNLCAKKNEF